jgi:hypothetical protein
MSDVDVSSAPLADPVAICVPHNSFDGVKFPDARRTVDIISGRFSRKLSKRGMHFLKVPQHRLRVPRSNRRFPITPAPFAAVVTP